METFLGEHTAFTLERVFLHLLYLFLLVSGSSNSCLIYFPTFQLLILLAHAWWFSFSNYNFVFEVPMCLVPSSPLMTECEDINQRM